MGPTGLPESSGVSLQLWNDTQLWVYRSLHNTFVQGMAQGTLARESFQHYVAQDAHFLSFFAKAYSLALAKCDKDPESHALFLELLGGVENELKLHGSYAEQWGVTLTDIANPSVATTAYTDFLMEVATNMDDIAEVLAATVPCARLYGFLGCALAYAYPHADHAYADWIRTYSSPDYLALPAKKEHMLDRVAHRVPYARLLELYERAMVLEADFFAAQPHIPLPRRVSLLVTDFDETCSTKDTTPLILEATAGADSKEVHQLTGEYMASYNKLFTSIIPTNQGSDGAPSSDLSSFFDALTKFDCDANTQAEALGVLAGGNIFILQEAANKASLRPHCVATLRTALLRGTSVHILTASWCGTFVRSVLCSAADREATARSAKLPTPTTPTVHATVSITQPLPITSTIIKSADATQNNACETTIGFGALAGLTLHSNDLEFGVDGVSTGKMVKYVQGANDKKAVMDKLVQTYTKEGTCSVYVGDGLNDLAALLTADYGVVVGTSKKLRMVIAAYGIKLQPLASAPLRKNVPGTPAVLYEASDWEEIHAFVFPYTYVPKTTVVV